MRHATSWFLAGALALGLAVSAHAQQGQPTPPGQPDPTNQQTQEALLGQIIAKDDKAKTFSIQTDDGKKLSFRVSDATQLRSGPGETAELGDLKVGDRVMVQAQPAAAGSSDRMATRIQVQPRGPQGGAPPIHPSTPE